MTSHFNFESIEVVGDVVGNGVEGIRCVDVIAVASVEVVIAEAVEVLLEVVVVDWVEVVVGFKLVGE